MLRWLNHRAAVYWSLAIFSGLLSLCMIANRDVINNDGILYVNVAKAFLSGGLDDAIDVYHWPFYGILIGLVHRITGLGFESSAYTLNTLLLIVVCVVFVRIYEEISGGKARIWVAAILILALPVLNDYRDLVIRGYGFWASMLGALYYFIQYSRAPDLRGALKWQLCMMAAILFRLEGLAFLVLAPFCFLFMAEARSRIIIHIFRLNSLYILLAIAGVVAMLVTGALSSLTSVEIPNQLGYLSPMALLNALNTEAEMIYARNQFMYSVDEARLILASGLLMLVIVKVASSIGLPFLVVWIYGAHLKWLRLTRESLIVGYFSAIGLLTLVVVAGNYFFVSSRYTVITVLLISLITFQYADYLLRDFSRRKLHIWSAIAGVIILVMFLDSVISSGASKKNIRVASEWVLTEIAADERVACNEATLEFYTEGVCDWIQFGETDAAYIINNLKEEEYAYLLLWIGRKEQEFRSVVANNPALILEKSFPNNKGSSVSLYRILPGEG